MSVSSVRVSATKTARNAVIFVHGLGDSGEGWSWFPQVIRQSGLLHSFQETNFVFPNAPEIPISVNGGMRMPGWFDIYQFGTSSAGRQDGEGFLKSCNVIKSLVMEQIEQHNIAPEKILIGGFSQGAAVTMAVLGMLDVKIGGLLAISGFCPVEDLVAENQNAQGVNHSTPVFQGHGDEDPVVSHSYGQKSSEFYKKLGFKNWDFQTYAGVAHSTNDQELIDAVRFVAKVLDE